MTHAIFAWAFSPWAILALVLSRAMGTVYWRTPSHSNQEILQALVFANWALAALDPVVLFGRQVWGLFQFPEDLLPAAAVVLRCGMILGAIALSLWFSPIMLAFD